MDLKNCNHIVLYSSKGSQFIGLQKHKKSYKEVKGLFHSNDTCICIRCAQYKVSQTSSGHD